VYEGDGPRHHRICLAGLQQAASGVREGEDDRVLKAGPEFAGLSDVERESWQSHDPSAQCRQTDAWDRPPSVDRAYRHPVELRQARVTAADRYERWLMTRAAALGRCWWEHETDGRQTSANDSQDSIRGQAIEHHRGQDRGGRENRGGDPVGG